MGNLKSAALIALLTGCAPDVATYVNISPSAEHKTEAILEAVRYLNEAAGERVFVAAAVDSERRRDDEIVVRVVDSLHGDAIGLCDRTRKGVVVDVLDHVGWDVIAHELGHAAGLGHVDDPSNLMHPSASGTGLTEDQIVVIAGLGQLP